MGISTAKTYVWDKDLFQELGLKLFSTDENKEIFLGAYALKGYEIANVGVWVSCFPAQFWRFVVTTEENEVFEISTGSGSLTDYWDSVMKVAEGMFSVKKLD